MSIFFGQRRTAPQGTNIPTVAVRPEAEDNTAA
jgi:hypothetical protein